MDVQETGTRADPAPVGLSQREADARLRRGEGNVAVSASSRSFGRILRTNVFSVFNIILFVIGAALLALGRYNDAVTSVGLGLTAAAGVGLYAFHYTFLLQGLAEADAPDGVLAAFERFTGLSSDDVGFADAAATIGAQTALSTFVSYAAFLLVLFLKPPNQFFAAWTTPDGDTRPGVLVAVLVGVFSGMLFVPWFTDYFGLTDAARPVFETVLPALVIWFGLLTATYPFRVLDRVLGLDNLSPRGTPSR